MSPSTAAGFLAVNNRDKSYTARKLQARTQQLEASVAVSLAELDRADRNPALVLPIRVAHLRYKLAKGKVQMEDLGEIGERVKAALDGQVSLTDPDARSRATGGRGTGTVGCNV